MRTYDETQTLRMPRPRTTISFPRRPEQMHSEDAARPLAPAAEGPKVDRTAIDGQLRKHTSESAATARVATIAGEGIAETPGELLAIASTIKIKAALDPGRFRKLSRDISGQNFSFGVGTANDLALTVTLSAKAIQKAHAAIEQHGPANISLTLAGRLGPNNTVLNPGLAVNVRPQKAA